MADTELHDFILHLNRDAMSYLKEENYTLALKTLKDADKLLKTLNSSQHPKLEGITLNNFGCFYKRINKPNVALKFLKQACEKESVEPIDAVNLSGTLLNICAIYSQRAGTRKWLQSAAAG
jgi:tetratricopeptide (TPR) repeat protein